MPRAAALLVLALALLPTLDAAVDRPVPYHKCGQQGRYAPGSAFEANLRRLAATVAAAELNASDSSYSSGPDAGDRPDQVSASAFCGSYYSDANESGCGACVALAFREAQRLCPYERQAAVVVGGGACGVSFHEQVRRMEVELVLGDDGVAYTIPESAAMTPWWGRRVLGHLDRDLLWMLVFQATGLACVVVLSFHQWHRHVIIRQQNRPVTGDQQVMID